MAFSSTAVIFFFEVLVYNDILMAVRGDGSTGKIGRVSTEKFVGANISPNLIRIQAEYTADIRALNVFWSIISP
jgi:type I restriction enzyme S subunit